MSVPNQKIIRIEKDKYQSRFLQIGDEQWKKAFQSMRPTVFGLYLYLASNKDGYLLELSAAAVEREIGRKSKETPMLFHLRRSSQTRTPQLRTPQMRT